MNTWYPLPRSLCSSAAIASFENSSSKSISYHGNTQVKWTCLSSSTGLLTCRTAISIKSPAWKLCTCKFSLLSSLLMKSLVMHYSNTVWEDEAESLAGFFPCYFLVLLPLMLSHTKFMTVAFESWGQVDPAGPCCKRIRLPVWAEDEYRGSHAENYSGEQDWEQELMTKLPGMEGFLTHALVFWAWFSLFPPHSTQGLATHKVLCAVSAGVIL